MLEDKDIAPALQATNEQLEASREIVQSLANELSDVIDVIEPTLKDFANKLRASRMTTLEEIRQTIAGLRELRQFLLASDTAQALDRAGQLVNVAKSLGELRADGTLKILSTFAQ